MSLVLYITGFVDIETDGESPNRQRLGKAVPDLELYRFGMLINLCLTMVTTWLFNCTLTIVTNSESLNIRRVLTSVVIWNCPVLTLDFLHTLLHILLYKKVFVYTVTNSESLNIHYVDYSNNVISLLYNSLLVKIEINNVFLNRRRLEWRCLIWNNIVSGLSLKYSIGVDTSRVSCLYMSLFVTMVTNSESLSGRRLAKAVFDHRPYCLGIFVHCNFYSLSFNICQVSNNESTSGHGHPEKTMTDLEIAVMDCFVQCNIGIAFLLHYSLFVFYTNNEGPGTDTTLHRGCIIWNLYRFYCIYRCLVILVKSKESMNGHRLKKAESDHEAYCFEKSALFNKS